MNPYGNEAHQRLRDMTEAEITGVMNQAVRRLKKNLPRDTVFTLVIYDRPGSVQYATNAERLASIRALRECADRLEKQPTGKR